MSTEVGLWLFDNNWVRTLFCFMFAAHFTLISGQVRSQPDREDSLVAKLKATSNVEQRITLALELSNAYSGKDPEQSKHYAMMVLADSIKSVNDQVIQAYSLLGWVYYDLYEYDSSIIALRSALDYANKQTDKNKVLGLYGRVSDCYRRLGNFNQAFSTAFEGLELAEKKKAYRYIGVLNGKIGELYREQYETDKAIEHLKAAYNNYELAGIERGMLGTRVNLALAYKQKDANLALQTYEELLSEFDHLFDTWDSARFFSNLANINMDLDRFDEAEAYLLNALDCHTRINKPSSLAYCYKELGELYVRTNRPKLVIKYANLAFNLAGEISYLALRSQSSKQLSDAYAKLGQYQQSYQYLREHLSLRDSILNIEKIELSNELEAKYKNEQKEQQILLQQEQLARQEAEINNELVLRNALLAGVILLIIIGSIIYHNSRVQKHKNREIKQFADKVQELQSVQSRWFTNIAHELRTPLTLILGPIQNLLKQKDLPDKCLNEVRLAKRYGDQLVDRVNEILEVSRLESGKLSLNQSPTYISKLVRQTLASFESFADQRQIRLETRLDDRLTLNIDADKITTILNNLISNAIKFSPAKSDIVVTIKKQSESVDLAVTDQGLGIPERDLPHIFDRFYQASNNDQQHFAGSGVGLTLSQELAKLHGGLLKVENAENVGSTFTLVLPSLLVTEAKPEQTNRVDQDSDIDIESTSSKAKSGNAKPKLLLVEDHPDMRAYISDLLKEDYNIDEATNGLEGLTKLEECNPDIIISDVKMPEMDGLTFAGKVKGLTKYRLTPFIHLTAHANERDKLIALRTGVDDYLVKPFSPEELLVRIQNLIVNTHERNKVLRAEDKCSDTPTLSYDDELIMSLEQLVKKNLSESSFSVEILAEQSAMSVSSLTRHTKKMTGLTPGQFIRDIRLTEAIYLLENRKRKTISEIVYAVGFEDVSSFSRLFKKRFGKSPSAYVNSSVI